MLVYYKIKFHNGTIKEYKSIKQIEDSPLFTLNFYVLQRHIDKGPIVQGILEDSRYFLHPDIRKKLIIEYFKASILEAKFLDGRTKEAKKLPYFTFEDVIANY